ncbi:MAG: GPW/gp25 family protein [Hyphomicrobiales bacterium]|nr:GPW/gp25 family protein [Hyphomicrobiales bacterium]
MAARSPRFLGVGWAFPPAFDLATGSARMVKADDDIRESLAILFSTAPGERIMQPEYGCDLNIHLFDTIDETALTHLRALISDAILYFEPRIVVEDITFDDANIADGVLMITIVYLIEMTNSRSNLVFPYYLSEGTLANLS